jgi:hypothetical protein
MVIMPAIIVASQAVMRSTASMNRRAASGTSASRIVDHMLPVGVKI